VKPAFPDGRKSITSTRYIEDAMIKLEYDLYYIKNMAVSLDAYIMFHTAKIMLLGRGAY